MQNLKLIREDDFDVNIKSVIGGPLEFVASVDVFLLCLCRNTRPVLIIF